MGETLVYLRIMFLALAGFGMISIFVIRGLRLRALAKDEVEHWKMARPAPLAKVELERLRRWQRNMRIVAVSTLFYLGVMVGFASTVPDEAWIARWVAFLLLPAMVVAGVVFQFSVRCPRCQMLLGLQTSLGVPESCERCGVSFRR